MHGTFSRSRSSLAAVDPYLEGLVTAAEQYLQSDPYSSLVKLRTCAECLQQKLATHFGIALVDSGTGYRRSFADVRDDLKAYIDDSITKEFFQLYKDGSDGAHFPPEPIDSARKKAQQCIQRVHTIASWYVANFQKPAFSFRLPRLAPIALVACAIVAMIFVGSLVRSGPHQASKPYQPTPPPAAPYPRPAYTPTASTFVDYITLAREIYPSGKLDGIFESVALNPPEIVAKAWYKNAIPNQTQLQLVLESNGRKMPCRQIEAPVVSGSWFCKWQGLGPGYYVVSAFAGSSSKTKTFTIKPAEPEEAPVAGNATPNTIGAPVDLTAKLDENVPAPQPPQLSELRTLHLSIVPYIPQHVIFDDADTMVVRSPPGIRVLREGTQITGCGGGTYKFSQHGMYSFDSCGDTRANVEVTKYVRQ